jgi:2,3-bisphosphoglycerate-independent phosphoglycerate mutase
MLGPCPKTVRKCMHDSTSPHITPVALRNHNIEPVALMLFALTFVAR